MAGLKTMSPSDLDLRSSSISALVIDVNTMRGYKYVWRLRDSQSLRGVGGLDSASSGCPLPKV